MKKTLLFLSCLLVLLAGCSQHELDQDQPSGAKNTQSGKIRWYGAKLVEGTQTRGVADGSKRWNQDAGIYIKFINTPSDAQIINKIKEVATEWEAYAGIKFHYVAEDKKADVRIAFNSNGNDWLTWSYTGTDAKSVTNQNQPTAVFGSIEYLNDEEFKGDVLRLFGQILGLEYEQRHQEWNENGNWKTETQLQSYWEDQFEGYNMDWDQIREYVFVPMTKQNTNQLFETKELDELSVMAWPYYNRKQTNKLIANYELSAGDKEFIARLYPKSNISLPTIQEAWVDAGYFIWNDPAKTSLKITSLGAQQEYLPDVSDGEQLTTAQFMFVPSSYNVQTLLKRAPYFNTSNITSFILMFSNCTDLVSVPEYDTSKGANFMTMFMNCRSLVTIPNLDTSNGTTFGSMFLDCSSLTTIPNINTSNGENFDSMFANCGSLASLPTLDTSNGEVFGWMFKDCKSLEYIYLSGTSKGNNFSGMFYGCSSLKAKPEVDLSGAYSWATEDMFKGTPFQ